MKKLRTPILFLAGILLFGAVCLKFFTVFLSEIPFHQYRVLQARVRDKDVKLPDIQIASQISRLSKAMKWAPDNGYIHFEAGRIYHRLALSRKEKELTAICKNSGIEKDKCTLSGFLQTAIKYYDKAIDLNRYIGSAHFWKLMCQVSLDDITAEKKDHASRKLPPERMIKELRATMQFEGRDPAIYRFAADLAFRAQDEDLAAEYYTTAFQMSLDGLEQLVVKIALWESGLDILEQIIPKTPTARLRLSKALAKGWHFDTGKKQWDLAQKLKNETIFDDSPTNLVANGNFQYPLGSHFLGWELRSRKGVNEQRAKGASGLAFELNGAPEKYFHLTQPIPVEPKSTYRFSARVKPEGMEIKSGSSFGFEVIHPYDFSIWSACKKCEIARKMGRVICRGEQSDQYGYYTLRFDFTVPQPLRMVILRFLWSNNPSKGRVTLDDIRIERIEQNPGRDNGSTTKSIDYPANEE